MSSLDDFLARAYLAAIASGHPFPDYAACEAALESAWGTSKLAIQGNNLFGEKQHSNPIYDTLLMPTKEYENGRMVDTMARWVKFPNWQCCFDSRLQTLKRLASTYPHYAAALAATDGPTFIREVSQTWSTDPLRADKVLTIYASHNQVFTPQSAIVDPEMGQ